MKEDNFDSRMWRIPIFLIGTKSDLVGKTNIEEIRVKVLSALKSMFKCAVGENFIIISNNFKNYNLKKMAINSENGNI